MRRAALACVLALAGCGGGGGAEGPPPDAPTRPQGGPPPAWLETPRENVWLAYSSYCWTTVCADYLPPSCETAPQIRVSRGDRVRAHLQQKPRSLNLLLLPGESRPLEEPEWTVDVEGAFSLVAQAERGDASYAGCFVLTEAP